MNLLIYILLKIHIKIYINIIFVVIYNYKYYLIKTIIVYNKNGHI